MAIDILRLKDEATRLAAERKASHTRRRTGATDVITTALPVIEQLRAENIPWAVIASALSKQGVVQGSDRQALTGRRLCALISAIHKRDARRARKLRRRTDLVPRKDSPAVDLAPELSKGSPQRTTEFSESTLRAEAYANLQPLLKGQMK